MSTNAFESGCSQLEHQKCDICRIVSLQDIFVPHKNVCRACAVANYSPDDFADTLPLWIDEEGVKQYAVPSVLSCLREGEKLLIQQISVYVPLHHLKYGQLGAQGHIVSFAQDISDVCRILPRLPEDVSLIRVIKHFKVGDGEISSKSFSIRRQNVLDALHWLKRFNPLYNDIQINERNLDWIENQNEQQLPESILHAVVDSENSTASCNDDRGPAVDQIAVMTDGNPELEPCYGTVREFNRHIPKAKDSTVVKAILQAEHAGKSKMNTTSNISMNFPYVSPEPICEWTERKIFEKAFPWLFPGGVGGFGKSLIIKQNLADWMAKTLLYEDCRFARDKMWAFCALNYLARHTNQNSGGFFVESFFKQGPKTLEELQEQVSSGNLSWLNSISYFSMRVTGSAAYWRARKNEVFAWINHHLEEKHGPPSFFITLSCAEYHWQDIERLIMDRCEKGVLEIPDFIQRRAAIINDHSVVVQEYFHARVKLWLDTVGKDLFGIKHHWLRFEFAPSRGQIHIHMLAICNNLEFQEKCYELKDKKEELAAFVSSWLEETCGMTATCNSDLARELGADINVAHPSTLNFCDIPFCDEERDITLCQIKFQSHTCNGYCMRKRKYVSTKEDADSQRRRVCRCGAGVEANFMKCDTPGFQLLDDARVVTDLRGFERVDLPRNNRRVTQASTFLMRGWRGNCDIQLLIYKSHPGEIDASDVSRVTNYVVSYACKGNETVVEEKKCIQALIGTAQDELSNVQDVKRLARKVLNQSTKNRVVSKQEAICQLLGLPLYSCSEAFQNVSLSGNVRLGTDDESRTTFLAQYARRSPELWHMSLHQFFHYKHNEKPGYRKTDKRTKIPIYSGAQCEAVYPATEGYARGVLMIYWPWHGSFPLDKDCDSIRSEFENFLQDSSKCPVSVRISYDRARISHNKTEPTSNCAEMDYDSFALKPDQENQDLVDIAGTIYKNYDGEDNDGTMAYDFGGDFDWTSRAVQVRLAV
jgi:hypothetical protein